MLVAEKRPQAIRVETFKGGSLSETIRMQNDEGDFVRKSASVKENREYGFYRLMSQLKRLQRLNAHFPRYFPKVIGYGMEAEQAYYDLEYIPHSVNLKDFLTTRATREDADEIVSALIPMMQDMHNTFFANNKIDITLYVVEEFFSKVQACFSNNDFYAFIKQPHFQFMGYKVPGIWQHKENYLALFKEHFHERKECLAHGNLTLENILYIPTQNKLLLIDPYEENILESALNDYSQLLQCSNSYYGVFNGLQPNVHGTVIDMTFEPSAALNHFNQLIIDFLIDTLTPSQLICVKLFEISQFMRMLPFKVVAHPDKAKFFYGLGSFIFHQMLQKLHSKPSEFLKVNF